MHSIYLRGRVKAETITKTSLQVSVVDVKITKTKASFLAYKLNTFIGIVPFLITISAGYLTYILFWPNALFAIAIGIDNINFAGKNGVDLGPLAPLALILAMVILILFALFVGFTSGLIK